MNSFELVVWDDEGAKCTFYTVLKDGHDETETDKFFAKLDNPSHPNYDDMQVMAELVIEAIGNKYGAIDDFFTRDENLVYALPPRKTRKLVEIEQIGTHFPLRLYCLRINESIVILFDGGVKESQSVQDSPDLHFKFQEAQVYVARIEEALREEMIIVAADGRTLTDDRGNLEIIL